MAITRSQMRRQLRRNGGIMNVVPRQNYGIGSWIKKRVRKIIPNELADIASKAAPFVAPFNPLAAGIMRGVGRFDKRGSISDALKQGLLTYGGGQAARYLGGADPQWGLRGAEGKMFTSPLSPERTQSFRNLFKGKDIDKVKDIDKGKEGLGIVRSGVEAIEDKLPILKELPSMVKQQLLVGGVVAGATALYDYFKGSYPPPKPGENMEEYLAARKARVGEQMRTYMDSYYKFNPEYSALDDAGKDAFVAQYNMKKGGRVGLASGSPHSELPTFSEGVKQKYVSDEAGALPKSEGGVLPKDVGKLSIDDFDNIED